MQIYHASKLRACGGMHAWAAAIGAMSCLYWVPLAFRSLAMGTYGLSYGEVWQILI